MTDDTRMLGLLSRAQAGDAGAFGEIYDAYAARIYRFMLAQVSEPADAEDLTQQVFLKVMRSLERYRDRGLPFAAWLFRIARNTVIDFGRRHRSTSILDVSTAPAPDRGGDSLRLAVDRADIRAALAHLTPPQREVVLLRFFGGLTPREIGSLMGKREGTVRALQFRALASMKRHLEDDRVWGPATIEAGA